jgi:hypothetical protein
VFRNETGIGLYMAMEEAGRCYLSSSLSELSSTKTVAQVLFTKALRFLFSVLCSVSQTNVKYRGVPRNCAAEENAITFSPAVVATSHAVH